MLFQARSGLSINGVYGHGRYPFDMDGCMSTALHQKLYQVAVLGRSIDSLTAARHAICVVTIVRFHHINNKLLPLFTSHFMFLRSCHDRRGTNQAPSTYMTTMQVSRRRFVFVPMLPIPISTPRLRKTYISCLFLLFLLPLLPKPVTSRC